MHETALMESMLSIAKEQLYAFNISKVNQVTLKVGRLANVLPDALSFAFEAVSAGTIFAGAELKQEFMPFIARCQSCAQTYESMDLPPVCPHCNAHGVDIIDGTEVYLDSIDFDEA